MATVAVFVFYVIAHFLVVYSAESCQEFFCNDIVGNISFPFKNETQKFPDCGYYTVDCSDRGSTKIQFKEGGYWFHFESITRASSVSINDSKLQERIENLETDDCNDALFSDLSLPNSTRIIHISTHNLTLFRCSNTMDKSLSEDPNYACRNANYTYFTASHDSLNCSAFQIPILSSFLSSFFNHSALTAKFPLEVQFTNECVQCFTRGGKCLEDQEEFKCEHAQNKCFDEKGQFNCSVAKEGKCQDEKGQYKCDKEKNLKRKLGLGIVVGGPVFLGILGILVACFFLIRCYKKNLASSKGLSRNFSSQPYSKSDLEGGNAYFGVSVFTYEELKEATNHFDSEKEIGDGGFGAVYYGKLKDGREVAVKRLYEHNFKRQEQFMNEIEILTRLRHKNLVSLYGCTSRRSRELILVYEYISNGTVADHLHGDLAESCPLTWPIRMSIAIETANALSYLHLSDIVHRDVKTTNILLDNNFTVKVADFGLSRLFPLDVTHVSTAPQGTPGYVDPEYHQCYQLTSKSDVYSFGVVLVELISSLPAVDITRHRHEINLSNIALNKIQKGLYSELVDSCLGFESDHEVKRMTIAVAELAYQCLQQDNDARPTMSEVLETLQMIERGKDVPQNRNEVFDDIEMRESIQPPPSPECDELQLLKNIKPPFSPNSVTQRWPSTSSSTPNASC
ncbi:LEAF RUST 10 DISEASE-RESISTANCE LOCUS RECEPTOR-LIKE PROTEIN KINASE-like 1.1 isoform X2 [Argentina anserina]|uniref:LEAF RUST 10 DISEASE-RESISTANCE LOCUS RECEPTOR-LIKE PROTEIN KINASE-like 1.1 isoform X2 n=1 Tax=Argentina anserina TaxID=57926 RepID=UPI002176721C|nr:LEAF RUST 10 DISEASE-RESISTANCE LOCUS RECEPTOR-LIKE PROTEIN KINASE-like 1.1 isoform X2 [Potentilla anserina]